MLGFKHEYNEQGRAECHALCVMHMDPSGMLRIEAYMRSAHSRVTNLVHTAHSDGRKMNFIFAHGPLVSCLWGTHTYTHIHTRTCKHDNKYDLNTMRNNQCTENHNQRYRSKSRLCTCAFSCSALGVPNAWPHPG